MPYPVSPPVPPAIINIVPGEFDASAATAASTSEPLAASAPEPASEPAPQQAASASIELQILDTWLPEAGANHTASASRAELLGPALETGLPAASSEFLSQSPAPDLSDSPDLSTAPLPPQQDDRQALSPVEEFGFTIPASRLPELRDVSAIAQESSPQPGDAPANTPDTTPNTPSDTTPDTAPNPAPPAQAPQPQPAAPSPQPGGNGQNGAAPLDPATQDVLELNADRQEYDERNRVFQAEGNVELRFRGATLTATRLLVNVPNRIAVAEGDAVLTRGEQVLRGDRIEYNLVQNQGSVLGARGELSLSSISEDAADVPPPDSPPGIFPPTNSRASIDQSLQVFGSTGGLTFGVNTPGQSGAAGTRGQGIGRLRYEADEIDFRGAVWQATNVRITNDPFSPPELELRSNRVTVTPLGPGRTEIRARNPRLVFDQGFSLPLLQDRFIIDNRERNPGLLSFGFDEEDRGGFFIERAFDFSAAGGLALLTLTPQVLVQRAIDEGFGASSFGLLARLSIDPTPTTSIRGNATFTTFDFEDFEDTFRGSIRAQQQVLRHTAALEYSYRDRLYNGSLGFQDVQSSFGLVVSSPTYTLGNTGINLTYQGGVQYIESDANNERFNDLDQDIRDLLDFNEDGSLDNIRIELTRYQAAATLSRFFLLWLGTPLPATPDQGLRYSPNPIYPYVGFFASLRGVFSAYSNGDTQSVLSPSVGISGQFGHFSRPVFDYTAVGISYSYNAVGGETPFNFDRVNDIQTLSVSLLQQIYGPFRFGVQSTFYLESKDDREENADTTFILEYSRRTYALTLSYSPQRESGAVGLRISDFNWVGDPGPFTGLGADNVSGGVRIPGD